MQQEASCTLKLNYCSTLRSIRSHYD